MIYGTIICFGDSLTYGSRDEFRLSYPVELSATMSSDDQKWATVTLAVPHETTADMLKRSYIEVRKYAEARDLILLAGTNDAKENIAPSMFKRNYLLLMKDFKLLGKRIFTCTIPLKVGFGSPGYEWSINDLIVQYNEVIMSIGANLIDLSDIKDMIDGVHLSHDGNIEVARRVFAKIKEVR